MKVVEAPTLEAFESRVSNWKTTYNIPPPPTSPLPDLPHSEFYFYVGPVLQRTPPVIGARIIDMLIVGP